MYRDSDPEDISPCPGRTIATVPDVAAHIKNALQLCLQNASAVYRIACPGPQGNPDLIMVQAASAGLYCVISSDDNVLYRLSPESNIINWSQSHSELSGTVTVDPGVCSMQTWKVYQHPLLYGPQIISIETWREGIYSYEASRLCPEKHYCWCHAFGMCRSQS